MRGFLDRLPFRRLLRRAPRILIFDDYQPDRTIGAGVPRAVEMLRALRAAGAKVTMWPLATPIASGHDAEPHGASIVSDAGSVQQLRDFLAQHGASFDGIIVSRPHNMQVFLSVVRQAPEVAGLPPVFYDAEALYAERDIAMHEVLGTPVAADAARRMLDDELDLAASARTVLTVDPHSADAFRMAGHRDVRILGYSIVPRPTALPFQQRDGFLFVGPTRVESEPNSDAVVWFADHVLPLLRAKFGRDVSLVVAGMTGAQTVLSRAAAGVDIRGALPDLTDVYSRARVFVAPTRFAAGIPLKVYDAAAHGVPAVMTPILAHSIGWTHEREALIASTPQDFAAACHRLHEDRDLWERIRSAALQRVRKDCSAVDFDRTVAKLLNTIANVRR
jgi:Glycosyl transferases group 1